MLGFWFNWLSGKTSKPFAVSNYKHCVYTVRLILLNWLIYFDFSSIVPFAWINPESINYRGETLKKKDGYLFILLGIFAL